MSYDHSPFAQIFGICACDECNTPSRNMRAESPRSNFNTGIDRYYEANAWQCVEISAERFDDLNEHRTEMYEMGWRVGDIERDDYWKRFAFPARIEKGKFTKSMMHDLAQWDRDHAPREGKNQ